STNIPGLYALGEANFSDHGANRLGASALMQGLADGYFVLPVTIGSYLSNEIRTGKIDTNHPEFAKAEKTVQDNLNQYLGINGKTTVDEFHMELGKVMWDKCGMARNAKGLQQAISDLKGIREQFYKDVRVPGTANEFNPELEKAGRVADFLELGELMVRDALNRNESCGGHFREEHVTPDGEADRDDDKFMYVAAWEYKGMGNEPALHKESLDYEVVKPVKRNYK
ncbi:MAG TPA: fumarate reductase/succinate dehydrogenase flavoprotein subunit, partial [Chitinophagales bacterium]|nr:fumarate reductase/succinate dehydrogenase flavoprotein subunit [Chitinophagales bacterium]